MGVCRKLWLAADRRSTWRRGSVARIFISSRALPSPITASASALTARRHAKQHHLSVFLSLLHRSLVAVHKVENFKTRIVGGAVWSYEQINAGSAVGRENGTIGLGHYQFRPQIDEFVREAAIELDRVRQRSDIERYPEANLIRYSVLPWFDFTSISHARDFSHEDSAPRITFGKITEAGGRCTMPVSIHVHHALADGLHVAQFVEKFQYCLDAPDCKSL